VAPSYSLIADYFPPHQRAARSPPTASASDRHGGGHAVRRAAGGAGRLALRLYRRRLAGLVLAPIFKLTVKDPVRGGADANPAAVQAAPAFGRVVATILPKPSFWLLALGSASASVCGYGIAFWLPSFFSRSFELSLPETSMFYAAIALIGGMLGIWGGGAIADRFGRKGKGAYPTVPAVAFLLAMPIFFLAVNTDSPTAAFLLWIIPTGLNLAWLGPS
jgi:nitrate/nitrite transporter NarK